MKKNIAFLLLLLIMPLCFAGCGEKLSETYWIDSSKAIEEYFTGEQYQSVKNIEFSKNLKGLMAQDYGASYAELITVYSVLFNSSISYVDTYYVLMQNYNPQVNNKAFKNKIIKVNKNLDSFKLEVEKFIKSKEVYETHMTFTDKATAEDYVEKIRLLQFKQDYSNLIKSAHNLSLSMLDACRVGYYDFYIPEKDSNISEDEKKYITESNIRIAIYLTNAELLTTSLDMLELYNYTDANGEYANHWSNAILYYNTILKLYEEDRLNPSQDIDVELSKWKTYYDAFLNDKELFYDIKDEINFERLKDVEHDATKYAEKTKKPANKNKVEYFVNFPNVTSGLMKYVFNLFV